MKVTLVQMNSIDDKAVNLDQQRMRAGWAKHSIEIDCDHSPFFSAPDQLSTTLAGVLESMVTR